MHYEPGFTPLLEANHPAIDHRRIDSVVRGWWSFNLLFFGGAAALLGIIACWPGCCPLV